mgnify:CR=1 FL=1|jgi:hypothetical protein
MVLVENALGDMILFLDNRPAGNQRGFDNSEKHCFLSEGVIVF